MEGEELGLELVHCGFAATQQLLQDPVWHLHCAVFRLRQVPW